MAVVLQVLGKEEKAMFRAHSAACAAVSRAPPRLVDALLAGELHDEPALRRHVYCVLLKCKLISKDGKLQKAAVLGKMAARPDSKNATKVRLEFLYLTSTIQCSHATRV